MYMLLRRIGGINEVLSTKNNVFIEDESTPATGKCSLPVHTGVFE